MGLKHWFQILGVVALGFSCGGTDAKALQSVQSSEALQNPQFQSHGFWGNGPSPLLQRAPRRYNINTDRLAIFSQGCADLRGSEPTACQTYEEIDVLVSLGDALSNQEIHRARAEHPWAADHNANLKWTVARSPEALTGYIRGMVQSCKVIRYLFVAGHGHRGRLVFAGNYDEVSTPEVLANSRVACALTPQARVQFDNCDQACQWRDGRRVVHNEAWNIAQSLDRIFNDPQMMDRGVATQRDVRFLFHTGENQVSHTEPRQYFDWLYNRMGVHDPDGNEFYLTLSDEHNLALMFRLSGRHIMTDGSDLNHIPHCN